MTGAHRNIQSRNSHLKCRGTKNLPERYMFSLDIEAVETNGSRNHHDNLTRTVFSTSTCNRSPSNINIHVCWIWTESVPWHLVMKRTWRVSKLASHQSREKTHLTAELTQNSLAAARMLFTCVQLGWCWRDRSSTVTATNSLKQPEDASLRKCHFPRLIRLLPAQLAVLKDPRISC